MNQEEFLLPRKKSLIWKLIAQQKWGLVAISRPNFLKIEKLEKSKNLTKQLNFVNSWRIRRRDVCPKRQSSDGDTFPVHIL